MNRIFGKIAAAAFGAAIAFSVTGAEAATLYISEFATGVTFVGSSQAQIPPAPPITDQTVALSGTSAQSAAFSAKTHYVRLICDEGCSILVGTNPTAATTNFLLQQGIEVDLGVSPGQVIAAIANAAGNTGGGGGGGSSFTDEAAFTAGTTGLTLGGGFYQTTATSNALTNGQGGAFQLTAQRALFSNLRNASGTEVGTTTNPLQVSVANTGANGTPMLVTGTGGTFPVTGTFFQATQPVSIASAQVASGAFASGSIASGAIASGAIASGAMVDLGAKADATCGTAAGTCSEIALQKYLNANGIITTGTAGASSTQVVTVQGIASGTLVPVTSTPGAIMETATSGNVANATAAATLATAGGKTTYIGGFSCSSGGATVGTDVDITVTGIITATMHFAFDTGTISTGNALTVPFNPPMPASTTNTTIVVSMPANGTGNTNATCNAWGFQQ